MTLYLIGIGLSDEKDISVKGLEMVRRCDKVYLENYTSLLQCSVYDLEKFYGKKIILANREMTEQGEDCLLKEAQQKEIAFLVVGDPFSATTHIEMFKQALTKKIPFKVINNASVLTAIGITGLQLYKFGKTTSIPFIEEHPQLKTPYQVLKENQSLGLHTLFLLDLKPKENKFLSIKKALEILEQIEEHHQEEVISKNTLVVGCARLGSENFVVKSGMLEEVKKFDFGKPPYCLIIPSKMHFLEEEMLEWWK